MAAAWMAQVCRPARGVGAVGGSVYGAPASSRPRPSPAGPSRPLPRSSAGGCARPAAGWGGSRRRRGPTRRFQGSRAQRSCVHIPPFSTDACATASIAELRAARRVPTGEDDRRLRRDGYEGGVAPETGRCRCRCLFRSPDSRSKWRKFQEFERGSGYHAAHHLSVPMLGRILATGAHHSHRQHFLPQDRALGLPARSIRLRKSGRAPDKRVGTDTNPSTRQGEGRERANASCGDSRA